MKTLKLAAVFGKVKQVNTSASLTGRLISHHLQLLQHGRLISKAQVAAADAELLGEVVEVDLRREQRGSWEDALET